MSTQLTNTTDGSIPDAAMRAFIVNNVLGPEYFAVIIFVLLYGMSTVQAILYFQRSQEDHWVRKCTIVAAWLLNTALVSIIIYSGFCSLVSSAFGIPSTITSAKSWTLAMWYLLAGISDLMVYSVMIHIVWTMAGKKIWLLCALVTPSVPGFAGILAYTYISLNDPSATSKKSNAWTWYLPYIAHAIIDVVLCVALTTKLIKMHTGFKNSNFVIRILVMWSVNSGFLASTLIITSIILYAVDPQSSRLPEEDSE
ncbi:hypothetical protein BDY19DRAFT_244850 [Irpex rosettiformis]|uniref:Uncharacterized protein n=1 Tax=Irpex rosettiformis TaxID=378272 RepID=A0ACB8TZ68_9APHY|nr:hypothetical protein BDY19DRAFT_244850 [Irpex rosettiformis]